VISKGSIHGELNPAAGSTLRMRVDVIGRIGKIEDQLLSVSWRAVSDGINIAVWQINQTRYEHSPPR
jgi:hypothetical protein